MLWELGAVTERQKCAVLLKGLLTEFEVIKTLIEVKPINDITYEGIGDDLIDFAVTKSICNLKNGGPRGAKAQLPQLGQPRGVQLRRLVQV